MIRRVWPKTALRYIEDPEDQAQKPTVTEVEALQKEPEAGKLKQ